MHMLYHLTKALIIIKMYDIIVHTYISQDHVYSHDQFVIIALYIPQLESRRMRGILVSISV